MSGTYIEQRIIIILSCRYINIEQLRGSAVSMVRRSPGVGPQDTDPLVQGE